MEDPIIVIGAGPAGLTAAYEIVKRGGNVIVFESDSVVGGISRTVERDGWRFDIGGHRFFSKVERVEKLWHEILNEDDFLLRPRMSRIYYDGKYYDYPLKASNALRNMGVIEAARAVLSYGWARIHPPKDQTNYEGWLVARFGWRLYRRFFKTYTEKVWGVEVNQMPADWAAQRVKSLSLGKAIFNAILPSKNQKEVTSLIEEFNYPKFGPGMMWERCAEHVTNGGGQVVMNSRIMSIKTENGVAIGVTVKDKFGKEFYQPANHVISSMPIAELVNCFDDNFSDQARHAGRNLSYRDFLTVALVIPEDKAFPDNWIYIHSPDVKVGRIQNFGSWSPFLVKEGRTCLGLEYFVFEDDELWTKSDEELIAQGKNELEALGLAQASDVEIGYVFRMPKAYPYYDFTYKEDVEKVQEELNRYASNVYMVGRNGMHRYNNQDHSMMTALLTVENIYGANHDVWAVNVEEDYHEERSNASTGRDAPILPRRN